MRKVFLIFSIVIGVLFSQEVFAQNNQEPQSITGFGKLQLGMSINDIPELNGAIKCSTSDEYYSNVYKNSTSLIYEIVNDTNEKYPQGEYDRRVREFQIGKFDLTENITVTDVIIKFFNGLLYSIRIKDPKMHDLMETKYGEGITVKKEQDNTFQNGYGATFVKTDRSWTTKWIVNNPKVTCEYIIRIWYNDKGEERLICYILLEDNTHIKEIENESNKIRKRINDREIDKKKSELKGF